MHNLHNNMRGLSYIKKETFTMKNNSVLRLEDSFQAKSLQKKAT